MFAHLLLLLSLFVIVFTAMCCYRLFFVCVCDCLLWLVIAIVCYCLFLFAIVLTVMTVVVVVVVVTVLIVFTVFVFVAVSRLLVYRLLVNHIMTISFVISLGTAKNQ